MIFNENIKKRAKTELEDQQTENQSLLLQAGRNLTMKNFYESGAAFRKL